MKWLNVVSAVIVSLGLVIGGLNTAEARVGGGKSFGSKFSHNQNVQRSSADNKPPADIKQAPAQSANTAAQQPLSNKGRGMGMLGGLALGGLLGAMFFGGAFEGINFLDVLIVALIAFLLFKFTAAWMRRNRTASPAGYPGVEVANENEALGRESSVNVSGRSDTQAHTASPAHDTIPLEALRGAIPRDFDQAAFIDGAKSCYARLQKAWDEGDLAEIRQLTTDHVFAEIQDQYRARSGTAHTEVTELRAELLAVVELGSRQEAAVLFSAKLNEDGKHAQTQEVWHFMRSRNNNQTSWALEGIQQVEA